MSKINELRELVRKMIMREMSTTSGSGVGMGIMTPRAFGKRKNPGAILGYKPANIKKRSLKESKIFEDVINKAGFDIKFSDQAKDLMDYIHSNEKFEDDLQDITTLFDKMQADNVFSKEEAFKVYKEFVERAAREYMRDNKEDIPMSEYFLTKDVLDVVYYHLSKMETPQSGAKSDNIDVPPEGAVPPEGGEAGAAAAGGGGAAMGGGMGAAPEAGAEAGAEVPPEAGAEVPPEAGAEVPPEGEQPPKPEEVAEIKKMIKEIYEEIGSGDVKLNELEELRANIKQVAIKYAQSGEREFAKELTKIMNALDTLSDKFAMGDK